MGKEPKFVVRRSVNERLFWNGLVAETRTENERALRSRLFLKAEADGRCWTSVRCDAHERARDERLKTRNPQKPKSSLVAAMRRLSIRLWHKAQAALARPACDTTSRSSSPPPATSVLPAAAPS